MLNIYKTFGSLWNNLKIAMAILSAVCSVGVLLFLFLLIVFSK